MADTPDSQRLGRGRRAEVRAHGPDVLKLYFEDGKVEAFREAAILSLVERTGLPVPTVRSAGRFEGRWGLVMSRAPGESFAALAEREPRRLAEMVEAMARLHGAIHAHPGAGLPALSARLHRNIDLAAPLDGAARTRLHEALRALPEGDRICHGDFHPLNIVGPLHAPVVIDWPDAACGAPEADACRSLLLLELAAPALAGAYLEAYCRATGTASDHILCWMPLLAAARLAEGVDGETDRLLALVSGLSG